MRGSFRGLKAVGSGVADVDGFGFAVGGFHLYGEVVDAELVVELFTDGGKQLRMADLDAVRDVGGECVHAGRDRPDMQVVDTVDAVGFDYGSFDCGKMNVRRRSFEQDVDRVGNKAP